MGIRDNVGDGCNKSLKEEESDTWIGRRKNGWDNREEVQHLAVWYADNNLALNTIKTKL